MAKSQNKAPEQDAGVDINALEATYDATGSDNIHISEDKLYRYLKEYEAPIKLVAIISSSFTVGFSFLATILSSDFESSSKSFILEGTVWKDIFTAGLLVSLIFLMWAIFKAGVLLVSKKWITTEELIKKIKKEARRLN